MGKNVMRIQSEKSCERNHQDKKNMFRVFGAKTKFLLQSRISVENKNERKNSIQFYIQRFRKQLRFGGSKVFSQR